MSPADIGAKIDLAGHALNCAQEQLRIAGKELTAAKAETAKLMAKDTPEPETFTKIGNRYIAERDVKATIDNAVRAATEELIAKLAALDAPKKGKA